jgi:hypothetical protein
VLLIAFAVVALTCVETARDEEIAFVMVLLVVVTASRKRFCEAIAKLVALGS